MKKPSSDFFFFNHYKNVQTVLSSQAIKTQTVGWIWGHELEFADACTTRKVVSLGRNYREKKDSIFPTQSLEWKMRGREARTCRI